ncbi:hypothetical protein ACEN8K_40860, partial [Variovorax sp. CT11-76]
MTRCQRLPTLALCLALGVLLAACDPKPSASAASGGAGSGASPTGVTPAASGDAVDASSAHKG